jgi:hypothetical protein
MDVFNIETEQSVQHPTLVVSNLRRGDVARRANAPNIHEHGRASRGVIHYPGDQDLLGAVWIHVRKKGSTEMEPGLHYYAGRAYDGIHSARREIITLW